MHIESERIEEIGAVLNNSSRPLKERFRALFTLRNVGGPVAIQCIKECFRDSSALLKHELAYCLGQMQDINAIPVLTEVLENAEHEPMVRHEAAEALGAIGSIEVLPILEKYLKDGTIEVAETCELALERIKYLDKNKHDPEKLTQNPFYSIDPAPPLSTNNIPELQSVLLNEEETIFNRYRAMFALRNMRTQEATLALATALKAGSALFRHEIAFVLGQLQDPSSVPALKASLEDSSENEMVRHECAEALGAIATDDCINVLNKYLLDDKRVVKESCVVALDISEYEKGTEYQYANALGSIASDDS